MKLSAHARAALPKSAFAGPGRSYPVNDRHHAANAKARAKQQLSKGHLTRSAYEQIVRRANAVLAK
jgi:hypothetical protein